MLCASIRRVVVPPKVDWIVYWISCMHSMHFWRIILILIILNAWHRRIYEGQIRRMLQTPVAITYFWCWLKFLSIFHRYIYNIQVTSIKVIESNIYPNVRIVQYAKSFSFQSSNIFFPSPYTHRYTAIRFFRADRAYLPIGMETDLRDCAQITKSSSNADIIMRPWCVYVCGVDDDEYCLLYGRMDDVCLRYGLCNMENAKCWIEPANSKHMHTSNMYMCESVCVGSFFFLCVWSCMRCACVWVCVCCDCLIESRAP